MIYMYDLYDLHVLYNLYDVYDPYDLYDIHGDLCELKVVCSWFRRFDKGGGSGTESGCWIRSTAISR